MQAREDNRWWLEKYSEPERRAAKVGDCVKVLWEQAAPWREQCKLNARFYGESIEHAMSPRSYRGRHTAGAKAQRLSLNVTKAVTDTRTAMLTHDQIRVACVTTGGEWDLREKAELTEQAIAGCFYETDFESTEQEAVYDSAQFEPGWVRFYEDDQDPRNPRPMAERVFPWDVLYAEEESIHGIRHLKTFYYVPHVDRMQLIEEYPDLEDKILGAMTDICNDGGESAAGQNAGVDMVRVVHAWHLPRLKPDVEKGEDGAVADDESEEEGAQEEEPDAEPQADEETAPKAGAGGGRYVMTIGRVVLEDVEYTEQTFPFEPLFAKIPTSGLRGISLVEELSPIAKERNVISQRIQRAIHLVGQPHLLCERNSRVNSGHLDNQSASIIWYNNTKPEGVTFPTMGPEVYQRESTLGASAYEIGGVSPQLAQGQLPAGLESGEAQRVHADIASARFRPTFRLLQDFRVRCARQFVRLMNRIAAKNKHFFVKPADHEMRDAIVWAEARMEDTDYSLRLAPENQLADDPEGRDGLIQDLMNGQAIPIQDGMKLLAEGRADLVGYLKEQPWYASYRYGEKSITNILRGRDPLPVVGFMDLGVVKAQAQAAYLDAAAGGCPDDRLERLLGWLSQVQDKISGAQASSAPPPMPAPAAGAAPLPGGPIAVAPRMAPPPMPGR